jgi:hypothetical protein
VIAYPAQVSPSSGIGPRTSGAQPLVVNEAMRQQAAALLQHTYRWLEAALPVAPQMSTMAAPLITAVQLYQAQQYDACLYQMHEVIGSLRQARWAFPMLPPL